MKRIIFVLMALLVCSTSIYAQKVKKEKKVKSGVSMNAGMMTYSADQHSVSSGIFGGLNYVMTTPMSKNPESRWLWEISLGLDFCSNKVEPEKMRSGSDNETFFEVINIGIRPRYILNPMGTRGHWYVFPGLTACPLALVPYEKWRSSKSTSQKKMVETTVGISMGGECGVGYATRHLGFSVAPFVRLGAPYSSKDSAGSIVTYGGYATIYYMF